MTPRPDGCPQCGSEKVAGILYGLPSFDEGLERRLHAGEVVLGGCTITDDDPLWHGLDCRHHWGKREVGIWEALGGSD